MNRLTRKCYLLSLVVLTVSGLNPFPLQAVTTLTEPQQKLLSQRLDHMALELSLALGETSVMEQLIQQMKASPRKGILELREFLEASIEVQAEDEKAEGSLQRLGRLSAHVFDTEAIMDEMGMAVPRLELKLPVRVHMESLSTKSRISVSPAPFVDESELESLAAYLGGKPMSLSASKPPENPALVITPAEEATTEPSFPLPRLDGPDMEENDDRIIDDFIGIPIMRITDDHEAWPSGDPEIYVRMQRCKHGTWRNTKENLRNVNDENVWYWLGDRNDSTYRFVNCGTNFYYTFYEYDSTSSDDFVGACTVRWRNFPFTGYSAQADCYGDIGVRIDRD